MASYGKLKKSLRKGGVRAKQKYLDANKPSFVYREPKNYTNLKVDTRFFNIRYDMMGKGGKGNLFFTAVVKSEDPNRASRLKTKNPDVKPAYKVTVQFKNIILKDTPTKEFDTEIISPSGVKKYYKIPNFNNKQIAIKCQCADFRHRFAWELKAIDGLFGQPKKYPRQTPPYPVGYPKANFTHKEGFCKHIHSLHNFLVKFGYAKGSV